MKNKNPRSKFTLAFKQDAVKLVIKKGYTTQQAADSLGVSCSTLRSWVRAERAGSIEGGTQAVKLSLAEREELIFLRKERRHLLIEREILKKADLLCEKKRIRFQFIDEQKETYPVHLLCCVMQVSRSAFYEWKKQSSRPPSAEVLVLQQEAVKIFHEHKQTLGSRRLRIKLNEAGFKVGRFKTRRLMALLSLKVRYPKRY